MNKRSTIKLTRLQVCPYGPKKPSGMESPEYKSSGSRSDFLWTPSVQYLAVAMTFSNEKIFSDFPVSTGVRCPVTATLYNTTEKRWLSRRQFQVYLPKDLMERDLQIDLPFDFDDLDPSCEYRLTVKDERTATILGEQEIHLFDPSEWGPFPLKWYEVQNGCISRPDPQGVLSFYRTVDVADYALCGVRFDVFPAVETSGGLLPELEIRLYYPLGEISSVFVRPRRYGSYGSYYVEQTFSATPQRRGLIYAELLCMEVPVSGFVFSTDGPDWHGEWYDDEMGYIVGYTVEDGAFRYRKLMAEYSGGTPAGDTACAYAPEHKEPVTEAAETDADDFDRRLNEFISSCQGDDTDSEEEECRDEKEPDESPAGQLSALVGLDAVKKKLSVYEKLVKFNSMRVEHGFPSMPIPLHAMFLGAPGTGKTTVAKYMGKILADAGLLSKGHVVVRERATLLGQNYHSESEKTLEALSEAQGGILLIDEAYQLFQPNDPRDPGKFVIETLMTALSDERKRDWMLILAGYPQQMKRMFEMNPGFKSRIPESNIYRFDDFTESQLLKIAEKYFETNRFMLSDDGRSALCSRLEYDYNHRSEDFGNARHVINLIQTEILPNVAVRVVSNPSADATDLSVIIGADVPVKTSDVATPAARIGFIRCAS